MKVLLNSREWKLLKMSADYLNDPFGSPNHLFMTTLGKFMETVIEVTEIPLEYNKDDFIVELTLGKE